MTANLAFNVLDDSRSSSREFAGLSERSFDILNGSHRVARHRIRPAFAALAWLALAGAARAAGAQEIATAADSAKRASVPGIWASAGLGLSMKGGPAWLAGINYSPGIALISIDAAGSDLLSNSDVQVRAVMLGVRSHELHGLASASLGWARAHRAGGCGGCGTTTPGPTASALAFSAAAHANRFGIGFALGTFGVAGRPDVRYLSFLLSLEAGWFGESR